MEDDVNDEGEDEDHNTDNHDDNHKKYDETRRGRKENRPSTYICCVSQSTFLSLS